MKRYFLLMVLSATASFAFADYASRGKPWDDPDYHGSNVGYVVAFFVIVALLIIGIAWLIDVVKRNKEQITNALGVLFAGGLFLGGAFLVGKCGEMLKKSQNKTENNLPQIAPTQNIPSTKENYQQIMQQQNSSQTAPTLKYRTVEYLEECVACGGKGKVVCSRCNGVGYIEKTCHVCNGVGVYGNFRCFDCQGKGYYVNELFDTEKRQCFSCGGTGYTENKCSYCSGSGKEGSICDIESFANHTTHNVKCSICNGSGEVVRTRQECYYD